MIPLLELIQIGVSRLMTLIITVYLEKTLPFAGGMSYRNQPTDDLTAKMIRLVKNSGYHGWYGIESDGREAIKKGKELLNKYLFENERQLKI